MSWLPILLTLLPLALLVIPCVDASLERIVAANPNYYLVRCVVVAAVVGKSREDAGRRLADIAARSGFCVEKVL